MNTVLKKDILMSHKRNTAKALCARNAIYIRDKPCIIGSANVENINFKTQEKDNNSNEIGFNNACK